MKKYIYLALVLFLSFYQNIFASFDSVFESTVFFENKNTKEIKYLSKKSSERRGLFNYYTFKQIDGKVIGGDAIFENWNIKELYNNDFTGTGNEVDFYTGGIIKVNDFNIEVKNFELQKKEIDLTNKKILEYKDLSNSDKFEFIKFTFFDIFSVRFFLFLPTNLIAFFCWGFFIYQLYFYLKRFLFKNLKQETSYLVFKNIKINHTTLYIYLNSFFVYLVFHFYIYWTGYSLFQLGTIFPFGVVNYMIIIFIKGIFLMFSACLIKIYRKQNNSIYKYETNIFIGYIGFFIWLKILYRIFEVILKFFEKYNISSISIYITILYILVIFSFLFGMFFYKGKIKKIRFLLFWIFFWIIYGFVIEKNLIFVEKHKANANFNLRMGLISDVHVSFLKNKGFLKRVVDRINQENLDILLVAGDWTFFITEGNHSEDLKNYLAPLKNLQIPTFAIIGNHDVGLPGPHIEKELIKTLKEYGIILLDNNIVKFPDTLIGSGKTNPGIISLNPELPKYRNYNSQELNFKNNLVYIVGLGELWQGNADLNMLKNLKKEDNAILLVHNPDILKNIKPDLKDLYDFAFAGHLHGGQIRLPFIYKFFLPTNYDFDNGFYDKYKLFITSGIGEVGILARFFNPPKIDIFEFGD